MNIYKYEYEDGYTDKDKTKEYGGLIVNGFYLWGNLRSELTRVTKWDKEIKLE